MNDIDFIKQNISIEDVLSKYSPAIKRRGDNCCCEFCGDSKYKLQIYNESNSFFCHRCNAKSDVIDYVAKKFDLSCFKAIDKIMDDFRLVNVYGYNENRGGEFIENNRAEERALEKSILIINDEICSKLHELRKIQIEAFRISNFVDAKNLDEIRRLEKIYYHINDIVRCEDLPSRFQLVKSIKFGEIKI